MLNETAEATIVGGWTAYHELTAQDRKIWEEAMKGWVGVHYTPTSVSTQVVAGMNYRFKCDAQMPPQEVIWQAIVQIYDPLDGKAHVTDITRI